MENYNFTPIFSKNKITVAQAAQLMNKDQVYIREGIKSGRLPIGTAIRLPGSTKYSYYISPKLFWEYTGIIV